MKLVFILLACLVDLSASAQFSFEDFKNLDRINVGHGWEMKTKKGSLIEKWSKVNDSLYSSISYRITGKDTAIQETIKLKYQNGSITYTPNVPDQNEGKPVVFTLKKIDGLQYSFENREHDFPQKIVYKLGGKTLDVVICGNTTQGYKEVKFDFVMR